MKVARLGSCLTFAATLSLAVVLGTFVFALISNESKRIPGTLYIEVVSTSDDASVGISWGAGIIVLFVASAAIALFASSNIGRPDR